MSRIRNAAVVTFGGLALIIAIKLAVPTTTSVRASAAIESADAIELNGVLYDFSAAHPDFDVPAIGSGPFAGNVQRALDGTRRPVFAPGGYRVVDQWEDRYGRPIAPHVSGMRGGLLSQPLGFRVNEGIELKAGAVVDAFDSNEGPYGTPGNVGRAAVISTNSVVRGAVKLHENVLVHGDVLVGPRGNPVDVIEGSGFVTGRRRSMDVAFVMPAPSLPEDLEPYREVITIDSAVTLTGDLTPGDRHHPRALHCGDLRINNGATLTIDGDLVIRCDRRLDIRRAEIVLRPGATLTVHVSSVGGSSGDVRISDRALVNTDTGDASRVAIIASGPGRLLVGRSHVYATIVAPERRLEIRDGGQVFGAFIGESVAVERHCGLHADLGIAAPAVSNRALSVRESIRVGERSTIDSFDSNEGPYGGDNARAHAWVSTNAVGGGARVELEDDSTIQGILSVGPAGVVDDVVATDSGSYVSGPIGQLANPHAIPFVAAPELGPSQGDRHFAGGVHLISTDLRCRNMSLEDGAVVNIFGNVTIRVDNSLTMKERSDIRLDAGATLTLAVGRSIRIDDFSRLNGNTGNPQLVSVRMTGPGARLTLKDHAVACAWVQGSRADLEVADRSEFFGSFAGRSADVRRDSWFHVDTANLAKCFEVFDAPGSPGESGNGGVTSAASFNQWFRPVRGVNEAIGHEIRLVRDSNGVYSYIDDAFYPLDELGKDAGARHNNNFTAAFWARFRYDACEGKFVSFEGGDGAWLFIDGRLVLDLGGVRSGRRQFIDIDRLGLEPGRTYSFRLFTAQRCSGDSVFRLRTNIELMSDHAAPEVGVRFE